MTTIELTNKLESKGFQVVELEKRSFGFSGFEGTLTGGNLLQNACLYFRLRNADIENGISEILNYANKRSKTN